MSKRGNTEVYIFLAFAVVALVGLTYTMLDNQPTGMSYRGGAMDDIPLDPTQFQSNYMGYGDGQIPISDQPGEYNIATQGSVSDIQSDCFGTQPGRPRMGQEPLAGAELRACLANAQVGVPRHHQLIQECYTCSGSPEGLTADDMDEAITVCQRVGGSSATITNDVPGPCNYG